MICNVFGLGAAATPPGLLAMEQFEELEEERRKNKNPAAVPKGTANREMCTFLILNISSLQLIPVNVIAYRSQYGSVHPTAIVGPALAATAASTVAAVLFCKCMENAKAENAVCPGIFIKNSKFAFLGLAAAATAWYNKRNEGY